LTTRAFSAGGIGYSGCGNALNQILPKDVAMAPAYLHAALKDAPSARPETKRRSFNSGLRPPLRMTKLGGTADASQPPDQQLGRLGVNRSPEPTSQSRDAGHSATLQPALQEMANRIDLPTSQERVRRLFCREGPCGEAG